MIADADTVGLVLVLAREIELRLGCESLGRRNRAHRHVGRHASHGGEQDGRDRRRRRDDARARAILDAARDVALGDVRDLVRVHAGELALVARVEQQPRVDADESAGQRKRVDGRVVDQEETESPVAVLRHAREPQPEGLQVLVGLRVLEHAARVPEAAHDHAADPIFVLEAERGRRRRAHLGQLVVGLLGARAGPAGRASPRGRGRRRGRGAAKEITGHASVRPAAGPGVPWPQGLPGQSISDATSARRERSPRISVTWP